MRNNIYRSYFLLICLLLSSVASAYDFEVNGIYYKIISRLNMTCAVTYREYKDMTFNNAYYGSVSIPSTVTYDSQQYTVTSISNDAFRNSPRLLQVIIPRTVTSIGSAAFKDCTSLFGVIMPESIENIAVSAFYNCNSLLTIELPNSITSMGNSIFHGCTSLKSVTLPNNIESIGKYTFEYCYELTSITIPDKVTTIEDYAFRDCTALESIDLPAHLRSIGEAAFSNCASLSEINLPNGLQEIGPYAFSQCSKLSYVIFPPSMTRIKDHAFEGCSSIPSLTIPSSMTDIEDYAFKNCSSITSLTLNDGVKMLGIGAFIGCNQLLTVTSLASEPPAIFTNTFPVYGTLHIYKGDLDRYQEADFWNNFEILEDIIPDYLTIDDDKKNFSNKEVIKSLGLIYKRTFNDTSWQPLYIPFSMSYDDWKDNFDLAQINAVYEYDKNGNGIIDKRVLEIIPITNEVIRTRPNYPYLIKAKYSGDKSLIISNAVLYETEINSIECSTAETSYTFTGSYTKTDGMHTASIYCLDSCYLQTVTSHESTLNAFRWYMTIESKEGSTINTHKISIRLAGAADMDDDSDIIDDDVVEIDYAASIANAATVCYSANAIYTLDGRIISKEESSRLKPGIYIVDGKKVIIKR